jgi:outer membrane receptor protein involved in Fe transport
LRTVAVPHLQTTVSLWTLRLDSELVFEGDAGITAPSRPSERHGIEWTNYYRPWRWLVFDGDLSWSRARFTASDPAGDHVPDAVGTVASAGATVNNLHRAYGGLRWRYFGPRTLLEDASVRSKATSLVNVEAGYRIAGDVRVALNVFNLFNASSSDIDYYYVSRLTGEPSGGLADWHFHPVVPRTARVNLILGC